MSECLKGNQEAWAEMREYNIDDVLSLEELYNLLSSWDNKLPNFDVYCDEVLDMSVWEKDGFVYTNLGNTNAIVIKSLDNRSVVV